MEARELEALADRVEKIVEDFKAIKEDNEKLRRENQQLERKVASLEMLLEKNKKEVGRINELLAANKEYKKKCDLLKHKVTSVLAKFERLQ